MSAYTLKNLTEVQDMAPALGAAETQEVRFARADLEAERVGFTHHRVAASRRRVRPLITTLRLTFQSPRQPAVLRHKRGSK